MSSALVTGIRVLYRAITEYPCYSNCNTGTVLYTHMIEHIVVAEGCCIMTETGGASVFAIPYTLKPYTGASRGRCDKQRRAWRQARGRARAFRRSLARAR